MVSLLERTKLRSITEFLMKTLSAQMGNPILKIFQNCNTCSVWPVGNWPVIFVGIHECGDDHFPYITRLLVYLSFII